MLYHKISGPFKRATEGPRKNLVRYYDWTKPEFEALSLVPWIWREKLDGTNIRVIWDGYTVSFAGRTDKAVLHPELLQHLIDTFSEELLEQTFGGTPAILFGEGVGPGIQKGGERYSPTKTFVLFDVFINGVYLLHHDVDAVAKSLGITVAPVVIDSDEDGFYVSDVYLALGRVEDGLKSAYGDFIAEGLVGTPRDGLLTRRGERIIMKVKSCDFFGGETV